MKIKTTGSSKKKQQQLYANLAILARRQVLVGVPEDHTARRGTGEMTNAGLVYLHTHGSPLMGLPSRPIIEPAIKAPDNQRRITRQMGKAAKAVLDDQPNAAQQADEALDKAGMLGANAAKRWFTDARNGWAPNSPETAKRKGSDRPLIDTAQMRRAITYVVEK